VGDALAKDVRLAAPSSLAARDTHVEELSRLVEIADQAIPAHAIVRFSEEVRLSAHGRSVSFRKPSLRDPLLTDDREIPIGEADPWWAVFAGVDARASHRPGVGDRAA
jgi:hypothetical protein